MNNLPTILLLDCALGTDAFSMAVGIGVTGIKLKSALWASAVICLFHIIMPLVGLSLGTVLGKAVGQAAGILGALVLIFIGVQGIVEYLKIYKNTGNSSEKGFKLKLIGDFWGLVVLAGSVSLDALTVGFGLGTFNFNLPMTVGAFGAAAGLMAAVGFLFGSRIGGWLGNKAEFAGSLILFLIGIKMIAS